MTTSMKVLMEELGSNRPFKVAPVKRDGKQIMVGYLAPEFDTVHARSPAMIEMVRKQIIDEERSQGVLVREAEYWIGDERIGRWS